MSFARSAMAVFGLRGGSLIHSAGQGTVAQCGALDLG